ncbi:glutamyl-tRNA reductase [Actinocatenispora thailandica]|uniref:Glutamyl-tRNA reductase n=1 Tax=Actinocatenispora thailandica TaxID=227318 RepID=A0A7R7DUQ1_9ACTN|nr:glutamyl-tRNA reductase [Actinocatenispora thailandica]BCJ38190.1 glutamyl-tRNA reductase [Actinocatenispora thailandica]
MNLLVVGLSHRTAPVELLEKLSVPGGELPELLRRLLARPYVAEAVVLSTCNRVEVYAAVSAFHGALADIGAELAGRAGCDVAALASHLYVHYDDEAVRHAFRVAGGLDSMVVGEAQALGQLRDAYAVARDVEAPGRLLHELLQQALRVGKRVHSETGIDRAGQNVLTAALSLGVDRAVGAGAEQWLAGRRALVVGAGAMGALSAATLARYGVGELVVANRGVRQARRLAERYGGRSVGLTDLADELAAADLVVSATASTGHVLGVDLVAGAIGRRAGDPLLLLDLAIPRDVEAGVAGLPGVVVVDIERLGSSLDSAGDEQTAPDAAATGAATFAAEGSVPAAERIVADELDAFLGFLRSANVAPTVAALRGRADDVVAAELRRLAQRRPELTDAQRAEMARTVHRVVQRLLHQPTVRVRQLAAEPGGDRYAEVLRELFDLDVADGAAAEAIRVAPTESRPISGTEVREDGEIG